MTGAARQPRIAILGGGMAGLTAAFELSRGDWQSRYESITVYQRGWRLGGKGASSRGAHNRIEEHGLHVLLGYYQDTFRIMDECYRELDRPRTRPEAPIRTWDEAVKPAATVGLTEEDEAGWHAWSMAFPTRPGRPGARETFGPMSPAAAAVQAVQLLASFYAARHRLDSGATVTAEPTPPAATSQVLRGVGLTALAGIIEVAERAASSPLVALPQLGPVLETSLRKIADRLHAPLAADAPGRVTRNLVDLAMTNLVGIVSDRLLTRPEGLKAIDDMDYRNWLRRHGASAATVDSAIVRGMYDLVFAYRNGDPERPAFSAGLGLELATRMLFDYDGSMFWKMQAGMGEVIFAPLYEALVGRGVEFRFFHRVDELDVEGDRVAAIHIGRQVGPAEAVADYQPLVLADGLPAWPAQPDHDQLESGTWLDESEHHHGDRRDLDSVVLRAGDGFDIVVFAASLGIVPHVASQLVAASPRWRAMVDHLATVATQAFQLWLTTDEKELGWQGGEGVTLSGFAPPFDTWASMSHLLAVEDAPAATKSIAYFCGSLDERHDQSAEAVRHRAVEFLNDEVAGIWPAAASAEGGFRWDLLAGDADATGVGRFDGQYWRANTDPSDRYVQSLPGTDRYRLSPGDTGFANLVIAGDWTDSGLNAGCLEAATRSGILAAEAVAERVQIAEEHND